MLTSRAAWEAPALRAHRDRPGGGTEPQIPTDVAPEISEKELRKRAEQLANPPGSAEEAA